MSGPPRATGLRLAALAGAIHLVVDALASRLPATTPPYLLLDHSGEVLHGLVEAVGRTTVFVTVSVMAALVNGLIAALLAVAFEGFPHRRRTLAWALLALWTLGGGLMMLVYLSPPLGIAIASLAAGIPRVLAIAWVLDRVMPPPAHARRSPAGSETT